MAPLVEENPELILKDVGPNEIYHGRTAETDLPDFNPKLCKYIVSGCPNYENVVAGSINDNWAAAHTGDDKKDVRAHKPTSKNKHAKLCGKVNVDSSEEGMSHAVNTGSGKRALPITENA